RIWRRLQKSAVDLVWTNCGTAFYPNNDLRHDLGRALSAGSSRCRLRDGSNAFFDSSFWVDHRLSLARIHLGSDWTPQTSNHWRCDHSACLPVVDSLRKPGCFSTLHAWICRRHCIG